MRKTSTKQTILEESLKLFSIKGYDGVSVRDIATKVGIMQSSLYKHFKNKQAIFNALLDYMSDYYEEKMMSLKVPLGKIEDIAKKYEHMNDDLLFELSKSIFLESLEDEKEMQFRRMLMIEQFNNIEAQAAYKKFFIDNILEYQTNLFKEMMNHGFFKEGSPAMMALHFYSVIYLLIDKYSSDPSKQEEALAILKNHIQQFTSMYVSFGKVISTTD